MLGKLRSFDFHLILPLDCLKLDLTISVGGGFSGTSAESSSFRHGVFDRIVTAVEIVLPNGDLLVASPTQNADLFHGAASGFGTLGVVTLLEIKLTVAKTYVSLTQYSVLNMEDIQRRVLDLATDESVDFMDGIMFSKRQGAVFAGHLTDSVEASDEICHFRRASDPWFALYAQSAMDQGPHAKKYLVPLLDYLFRYDRGGFWVGKYSFDYFLTPFNDWTRWALDRFMRTKTMYHALHRSGLGQKYIVQDVAVPLSEAGELLKFLDVTFGYYPLWLCPLRPKEPAAIFHPQIDSGSGDGHANQMLLNFGIWGPGPEDRREFVRVNRQIERRVQELGGQKCLYAHTYYTEDEFWQIYDRRRYDELRKKYFSSHLWSVYDKVKIDVDEEKSKAKTWPAWFNAVFWDTWPFAGVYGVASAILRSDYLLSGEKNFLSRLIQKATRRRRHSSAAFG